MIKVLIANNMETYMKGKSDGIIFTNVSDEDVNYLRKLAASYNKQIKFIELNSESTINIEESDDSTPSVDKRKIKKIFVTNGKETIKIIPEQLNEYLNKGYRPGRGKKNNS